MEAREAAPAAQSHAGRPVIRRLAARLLSFLRRSPPLPPDPHAAYRLPHIS